MLKSPPGNPKLGDEICDTETLVQAFLAGEAEVIDRVHKHLPQVKFGTRDEAAAFPLTLSEAQTVIARENGSQSWGELRLKIKLRDNDYGAPLDRFKQLVYDHDAEALDELLQAHSDLKTTIDDRISGLAPPP